MVLYIIQKAKKVVPSSCLIEDNFFTHMGIKGNLSTNSDLVCSKHIGRDDLSLYYFMLVNHCTVTELIITLIEPVRHMDHWMF